MTTLNTTFAPLNTIISWFSDGAQPTDKQFETSWKSFWHKAENIPVEQIYQLTEFLNLKAERDHLHFDLAKKDGSNLSVEDINGLKEVLGVALAANGIINNIETTITPEDANVLQDGIYKPKTTGVYPSLGLTAKENYTTLFKKLDGVWSVFSEEKMPIQDLTHLENNNSLTINKGKSYPYVNQTSSTSVKNLNNVILNVEIDEVSHQENILFAITLISRNATAGNWGNAIHFRVLNVSDLSQNTSFTYKSTDTNISADILKELNKISAGGIQTLSIYNHNYNKWFYVTIDSDAIADNQLIDASYSNLNNKMYFSKDVYKLVTNTTLLASKTDLNATNNNVTTLFGKTATLEKNNSLTINKGKAYPFVNQPTESVITAVNNSILDVKIYGGDYNTYTYSLVGLYKNHSGFGNGIVISRTRKSDNIRGYQFIYDADLDKNTATVEQRIEVAKIALGGIQTIELKMIQAFGGFDIKIILDVDSIPDGYTNFGNTSNETKWINHIINPSNYLKKIVSSDNGNGNVVSIPEYETFKEALKNSAIGVIKIGQTLATNIVDVPTNIGDTENYSPSKVGEQYAIINAANTSPKLLSEKFTIRTEDNILANIKTFGKRYIYFGTTSELYRTSDEFKGKEITHLNTVYEKLLIPLNLPNSYRVTTNSIMNCFELDNGELLIEVRNGKKENEADDYRGNRTQLYLTTGLKDLTPILSSSNILEYNLDGILTKVHEYKAFTQTSGKTGTTISIVGNKIALAPYYIGLTGLIHYSNDFGKTWKVIFNMGVQDDIFTVPYKGSVGAYPLPENLIPPMPADMWTAGGNSNFHVHGVTIDPIYNRIYVSTGDSGTNVNGRTALWYTDDEGQNWTRMQTKGAKYDTPEGVQPMGVVCAKDYILMGTDSSVDGLYRASRDKKFIQPKFEAIYWYKNEYSKYLRAIYGGSIILNNGDIYSLFHPNTPTYYVGGVVVYTNDGINFQEVYYDSGDGKVGDINWGSFVGKDRFDNVYISNSNGTIIKLY